MSARAASSALLSFLLVATCIVRPAHAGPWLPAPGDYFTELRGGGFSAYSYHNDAGDRMDLGGTWEERSILSYTELGWKKRMSFVLAAPYLSVTASDGSESLTSTGLEDVLVGLRYGLHQDKGALAMQLDWQAPLGYSRNKSLFSMSMGDVALHGGGLQQFTLSLLAGTPIGNAGFLQLGAGYGYRFLTITPAKAGDFSKGDAGQMWSRPLQASADLGFWLRPRILLGGRYSGTITTSRGDLAPERTVHLAGPVVVWRVDERLDLSAGSWSTAMAKNSLHYDHVYVALSFKQTRLNRVQGFLGGTKAP